MSKFHFSVDTANEAKRSLSGLEEFMQDCENTANNLIYNLMQLEGFGIPEAIEKMRKEIKCIAGIGCMAKSGSESLSDIINSLDNTAKAAVKLTQITFETGVSAINKVIKDKTPEQQPSDTTDKMPDEIVKSEYSYEKIWHWSNRVAVRTDSAGGIGIFKEDGSLFETYNQNTQYFSHGEWNSQECTSTALAQCSTINGLTRQANDYNLPGAYHDDGTPDGATQIGGISASSADITRFCVDNLNRGLATVIYYNYAGGEQVFGRNGHAVTVVGANGNPKSVYDLNIIDPATGEYVNFGQAFGACANSMYICYETSPGTEGCGGAGTKRWDIEQYFGYGS